MSRNLMSTRNRNRVIEVARLAVLDLGVDPVRGRVRERSSSGSQ